jgi:hypothetical protein
MGQRTQVAINVKFIGKSGKEYVEREVYHYQWGGFHTGMFENLIGLFINARNYLVKLERKENWSYFNQSFENELNSRKNSKNWLKTDLVGMISSEKNFTTSSEMEYYEEYKGKNINELSEKEFWEFALNHQDCNDGRIIIDILLNKEDSYCKWNFLKDNSNGTFKSIVKNDLTKSINAVYKYWCEDEDQYYKILKKELKDIIKIINTMSEVEFSDGNIKKYVQYDYLHFKNKFLEYDKAN